MIVEVVPELDSVRVRVASDVYEITSRIGPGTRTIVTTANLPNSELAKVTRTLFAVSELESAFLALTRSDMSTEEYFASLRVFCDVWRLSLARELGA